MLFNTYSFILLFLPACLLGYYTLRRYAGWPAALLWLTLSSFYFYSYDEVRLLLSGSSRFYTSHHVSILGLILFSCVFNYGLGRLLARRNRRARGALVFGVLVNLGLLAYFKYAGLLVDLANAVFGADSAIPHIYLPLGISFYTFQQIAYLVDVYRGEIAEMSFMRYCLFVSFFPQLIAGPIVHHKELLPALHNPRTVGRISDNLSVGITTFSLGLAKKVLLADTLAPYATNLFSQTAQGIDPTFLHAWGGVLAYTLQIYFDFSGYSDMAIGLGRMFGIRLTINFDSPYRATNIIEFWRRWHITLSRFLRDYLYIALGGNRRGKARRYVNLMLTMLIGGLWHGANWTYMLWGGLHGLYLVVNHAWHAARQKLGRPYRRGQSTLAGRFASRAVTFLAVVVAWVFFKAGEYRPSVPGMEGLPRYDLEIAQHVLMGMCGRFGFAPTAADTTRLGFDIQTCYLTVLPLLLMVWVAPNTQQIMFRFRPALAWGLQRRRRELELPLARLLMWRPTPQRAVVIALLFVICILFLARPSEFIYWQF